MKIKYYLFNGNAITDWIWPSGGGYVALRDAATFNNNVTSEEKVLINFSKQNQTAYARMGSPANVHYFSDVSTLLIPSLTLGTPCIDWNANFTFNGKVNNPWLDIQDRVSALENATLPIASANTLGAIKVGTNLSIDSNGVLSADDTTYSGGTGISISSQNVISASAMTGATPNVETLSNTFVSEGITDVSIDEDTYKAKWLEEVGSEIVSGNTLGIKYDGTDWIADIYPIGLSTLTIVPMAWGIAITGTPDTDDTITITYSVTEGTNGTTGIVPAPVVADTEKYLKGDGTWSNVINSQKLVNENNGKGIGIWAGLSSEYDSSQIDEDNTLVIFTDVDTQCDNVPQSSQANYPTVQEFNALLTALKSAGIMKPDTQS
jgi:hypothetical protein